MTSDPVDLGAHVNQATGMVAVQANCEILEALGRLRIRADAIGHSIEDTAEYVIDGLIRFDDAQ